MIFELIAGVSTGASHFSQTLKTQSSLIRQIAGVLACCILAASIYIPTIATSNTEVLQTPFGIIQSNIHSSYDESLESVYTADEQSFVKKAQAITGDSLVINQPNDGSCNATWLSDMFLYYRDCRHYGGENETTESTLIREHLSEYETNELVQQAVHSIDATYLLFLDFPVSHNDGEASTATMSFLYEPELWTGIDSVNDETPGLELVLSEGDMRLHRFI